MKKATLWLLALALVIAPVAFAANDKDNAKKPSDTAKTSAGDAAKNDAKPANSAPSNAEVIAELEQMRVLMKEQSDQIAQQQRQLAAMQARLDAANTAPGSPAPSVNSSAYPSSTSTASNTVGSTIGETAAMSPSPSPAAGRQDKESPLSFRIGGAEFTPGGFVDFENVFRTTNLGSGVSTNFGSLPFNNTIQGHLTEFRASGQSSQIHLKVNDKFGKNDVTGYLEMDFIGNDAANVFVSSNSHTERLRLYWLDLKRGKWEFLGGQSWGLMTPNRIGVSPMPSDLNLTYNEDANYQVGLPLTRAGQFRVAYHPNDHWAFAAGIENPDQFVGAGETIFPFAFNAALGPQFDAGNQTTIPNVAPDFITKAAWDSNPGGRNFHVEVGGLLSSVKITNVPIGGTTFVSHTKTGGGVEGAVSLDITKDFRFVGNGIWGNGIGRYLMGLGPQAVVVPIQTGVATFDIAPSLVHSGAASLGVEGKLWTNSEFGVYYGGVYFKRNSFPDVTSPLVIKPIIGFGGINSPNSANRAIQEGTFDWTQTMWHSEQHGKLQLILQESYLTRSPWFVAAGAPKNAHLFMSFVSLRYVLP